MILCNSACVSTRCFACKDIGGAHADTSSGSSETIGASNANSRMKHADTRQELVEILRDRAICNPVMPTQLVILQMHLLHSCLFKSPLVCAAG